MRRTLETAHLIFHRHPNFQNMRFKIVPDMRERIRIAGDLPSINVFDMIENEFQGKFNGNLEIDHLEETVGFEQHIYQLEKDEIEKCWYMKTMDEDLRNLITERYRKSGSG